MRPLNLFTLLCLATSTFLLQACGGGGGGGGAATPPTADEPIEVDLSIADLGLPPGVELVGAFDPLAEVYFLRAGHLVDTLVLRPVVTGEVFIPSLGDFLPSFDSIGLLLEEGPNEAQFTLAATATLEERIVRFSIERERPDDLLQEHLIKSSGLQPGDRHGASLDILEDFMVVGSPFEDVVHEGATIPEAGAVYVYRREGQGWSEFARLQSIAPGSGDQFGASVAMDFGRLIVGAPGEDGEGVLDLADINENAPDCGAAYTYSLRDSGVEFDRYLKPDNAIPRKTKGFGEAVAVDGGLFVVGAPNEGTKVDPTLGVVPAPNAGAVYLFSIQGSATPLQRIQATDAAANQGFGSALGFDAFRLAVGAPGANGARGKVYVYAPGSPFPSFGIEAELAAPVSDLFDGFGATVDMDGGLLAVGAPLEDSGAEGVGGNQIDDSKTNSGAVYLFRRQAVQNVVTYEFEDYIKGVGNLGGERFGTALDLRGDRLCVGAPLQRRPALGEAQGPIAPVRTVGAAFFYVRRAGAWELGTTLTAPNAHEGAEFGAAVALELADLIVGSPRDRTFGQGIDASSVVLVGQGGGAVNNFR